MDFKGTFPSSASTVFKSKSNWDALLVFVQDSDATGNGTWSFYIDGIQKEGPVPKKPFQGPVVCYTHHSCPAEKLITYSLLEQRILH